MRVPEITSTPRSAVPSQIESSSPPFQSALDSGGRLYGGNASAPTTPIVPSASRSRMPRHAAPAVIPPPTMR